MKILFTHHGVIENQARFVYHKEKGLKTAEPTEYQRFAEIVSEGGDDLTLEEVMRRMNWSREVTMLSLRQYALVNAVGIALEGGMKENT